MRTSFRQIAQFMDNVKEINSVRELLNIHRQSNRSDGDLTLGQVFDRHRNCENEVKILFYNTFLIPGLSIQTFCENWFTRNKRLVQEIASIKDAPFRVERLMEIVRKIVENEYDYVFLAEVFEYSLIQEMNSYLNDNLESFSLVQGPKRDIPYRPIPLAILISLASVAELNDEEVNRKLLAAISAFGNLSCPPFFSRKHEVRLLNSGLVNLGLNKLFFNEEKQAYNNRGNRFKDADYYATKGILKTSIDLEIGQIEVYNTHLHAGSKFISSSTESEIREVKIAQVEELLNFIDTNRNLNNICVIVGDFNINGMNLSDSFYQEFIAKMNRAGFDDIWVQRCLNDDGEVILQPTSDTHNERICEVDGNLCNELYDRFPRNSTRIDYIFIERQNEQHSFILDYTRPRRVPFPNRTISEELNFLSDHLGLEITLKPSRL